jgi:hypothetical protein
VPLGALALPPLLLVVVVFESLTVALGAKIIAQFLEPFHGYARGITLLPFGYTTQIFPSLFSGCLRHWRRKVDGAM